MQILSLRNKDIIIIHSTLIQISTNLPPPSVIEIPEVQLRRFCPNGVVFARLIPVDRIGIRYSIIHVFTHCTSRVQRESVFHMSHKVISLQFLVIF